ncbi:hypothetical protein HC256_004240 [Beauveria bassiana]|nr:hypothetical protein HC256_004240 [Beauveria bassiana]
MTFTGTMPRGQDKINSPDWLLRQEDTTAYCELRHCHLNKDKKSVRICLARLSTDHARVCAKRLIFKAPEYAAALDPLLALQGLRAGFWLRSMHKVISLRFSEQVHSYWQHIGMTWKLIAEGEMLTAADVGLLEGKCPKYSESDASEIAALIEDGSLFPNANPQWRAGLLGRLKDLPLTTIRSLNTFFDDLRLMEQFVPCIYHIVDKTPGESCDSILQGAYRKPSGFETARRVLWRFLLRHFTELPRLSTRPGSRLLAKQRPGRPDEERLHALATLAHDLGFEPDKITQLRRVSAEKLIAKHALLQALKPPDFRPDSSHFESIQDAMVEVCRRVQKMPRPMQPGKLVSSTPQRPVYVSGFPDLLSYEREKEHLSEWDADFLQSPPPTGWHVTTLFRLQSLCHALFDLPTDLGSEKRTGRRESWETIMPEDSGDSFQPSESEEDEEASDRAQDRESITFQQQPHDVVFMELRKSKWRVLGRVESPNNENVQREAKGLCGSHFLAAISADGVIGFIAPEDCLHSAAASGINTVLAIAIDATAYDIDTISYHARLLYE